MIEGAVRNYQYYNSTIFGYMDIYHSLLSDTYGKNVSAGLKTECGVNGSGKIASGAESLPNPGAVGMLKEFDTGDGAGPRSSILYAYDGYRPHQTNQLVLIIGGFWPKGTAIANTAAARMKIGNTDLWYKIEKGYYDYANGNSRGLIGSTYMNNNQGFPYVRALWEDVLLPYHNSLEGIDTDGDGTDDATEVRLGLNANDGSSRFSATIQGNTIRWSGAAGLTFVIQRAAGPSGLVWQTIATRAGVSGLNTYTDPTPPPGKAFYRVGLNP